MVIIFVFFGDFKASLIVGSSIPTSILMSLIVMTQMGFSLNVITMSGLVLGVGMMVDNSIVVLESCFRAMDKAVDKGVLGYAKAALEGTNIVIQSIIGSTVTTCGIYSIGISKWDEWADVWLHGLYDCILYVCFFVVSHVSGSVDLYAL